MKTGAVLEGFASAAPALARPVRLRVLVITNRYPRPGHSTIATYNREQFRELAKDHDVRIVAPVPWTERLRDLLAHKSGPHSYVQDQIPIHHPTYYFSPKIAEQAWGQFFLWSVRREVQSIIREFKPDVLLACWAHPDGWAAVQLGRQFGLPVVVKVHGSDVLVTTRNKARRQRVAEALRRADAVVAVSRDLADHVVALGVDPQNVQVIHHGVDPNVFCPGNQAKARRQLGLPDGPAILFVGNLLRSKGVGVLMEACAKLVKREVPLNCYLVGSGRDEGHLKAQCRQLGLEGTVHFVGVRAHEQLPDWYRAADLVVLPSFSEGIPNVLREAMMCGRRFVATRVGGIPEITVPEVGTLVEPGNPTHLADAIANAVAINKAVDRKTAMKFCCDWRQSNRQLVACLTATCNRRGKMG
jgi:glycosyltransferase involved in cell wall biosynthesis